MGRPPIDATSATDSDQETARATARWLVIFTGGLPIERELTGTGELVLGRSRESDIVIDEASLSRRHARLRFGRQVTIEDLGSRNGTRSGGKPIEAHRPAPLVMGEPFTIGRVVCVVRAGRAMEQAPAAPPSTGGGIDELIALVAASEISVVLHGETGVGKEVTARRIHGQSARAARPFVGLNCAALPEQLLESELFGYERGAFSGAERMKPGLLETAEGGTVFLDEIADMSPSVQAKLLRVLEERSVLRLGALRPIPLDVRILAASHKDLQSEVERGVFREDLYYRLNGLTIEIPPLRERPEEIEPLALAFLAEASRRAKRPRVPALSDDVRAALRAWAWPGNVRELKNAMERAIALCGPGDLVKREHVPLGGGARVGRVPSQPLRPPAPVSDEGDGGEKARIEDALRQAAGNQKKAAELLGISRRTLINRLDRHGIARPRKA